MSFRDFIQHPAVKIILAYVVCILAHFFASHLYVRYCVPSTFVGLLLSPFMTLTPHCQAFRWVIFHGGNTINLMWFMVANWVVNKLTNFQTKLEPEVEGRG
jgi:hypothetical protein